MKSPLSRPTRAGIRLEYLRELSRFEAALGKKIAKIIAAQGKYLARWYRMHHEVTPHLLEPLKTPFVNVMKQYYKRVLITFAEKLKGSIRTSVYQDAFQQWLTSKAISTVDDVDDTTISIVQHAVRKGLAQGLSVGEIADFIEETTDVDNALARANVIARTEMHDAMNYAQLTAAKDTGLTLVKIWTASLDNRTRDAHAEADGQAVPIDDDFEVDGESISRPGDGDSANSINCRCCMIFSEVSDEEQ